MLKYRRSQLSIVTYADIQKTKLTSSFIEFLFFYTTMIICNSNIDMLSFVMCS